MRNNLMPANGQTTYHSADGARVLPVLANRFVPIRATTEEAEE